MNTPGGTCCREGARCQCPRAAGTSGELAGNYRALSTAFGFYQQLALLICQQRLRNLKQNQKSASPWKSKYTPNTSRRQSLCRSNTCTCVLLNTPVPKQSSAGQNDRRLTDSEMTSRRTCTWSPDKQQGVIRQGKNIWKTKNKRHD